MTLLYILIIWLAVFSLITSWFIRSEKKKWNNGVAPSGEPWTIFDTDSQGGRMYKDGQGNYCNVSYLYVDRPEQSIPWLIKTWVLDTFSPRCKTGIGHRLTIGYVTNANGNEFCWHPDCITANKVDLAMPSSVEVSSLRGLTISEVSVLPGTYKPVVLIFTNGMKVRTGFPDKV